MHRCSELAQDALRHELERDDAWVAGLYFGLTFGMALMLAVLLLFGQVAERDKALWLALLYMACAWLAYRLKLRWAR